MLICAPTLDPYINAATHLHSAFGVSELRVRFVRSNYTNPPIASLMIPALRAQFKRLADGRYKKGETEIDLGLDLEQRDLYRAAGRLFEPDFPPTSVEVDNLDELLRDSVDASRNERILVDITGLPKPLAATVMALCMFRHIEVRAFDLKKKAERENPEESLYHAIGQDGFEYSRLPDPVIIERELERYMPKRGLTIALVLAGILSISCVLGLYFFGSTSGIVEAVSLWLGIVSALVSFLASIRGMAAARPNMK